MKYKVLVGTALITLLTGCANQNPSTTWNESLIKAKAPVRMIKDDSFPDKKGVKYIENWAGVKGKSILNERYINMLYADIEKKCGYGKEQFIEAYIVQHTNNATGNIIEEVWLFNDSKSLRDDKISGLTVYLEYDKKTDFTKGEIFGNCHTGKGMSFTFSD